MLLAESIETGGSPVVSILVALLSGSGVVIVTNVARAFRSRGDRSVVKVEAASKIQQMALDFVTPLDARMQAAELRVDTLQSKLDEVNDALDNALTRARLAEAKAALYAATLTAHEIPVPLSA